MEDGYLRVAMGQQLAHQEFSKRRTDYFESDWFMRNVLS
jgi:hypothetical protein